MKVRQRLLVPAFSALVVGVCLSVAALPARGVQDSPKSKDQAGKKADPGAAPKTETGVVNINTATLEQLEMLPGVGPVLARAIVEERPYKSVDELDRVRGIGPAKLASLREYVTIEGPTTLVEAPKAKGGSSKKAAPPQGRKIDLNTASQDELETLPGIGPAKARAIIAGRPYAKIEDVMKVSGIKGATFEKIKDYLSISAAK